MRVETEETPHRGMGRFFSLGKSNTASPGLHKRDFLFCRLKRPLVGTFWEDGDGHAKTTDKYVRYGTDTMLYHAVRDGMIRKTHHRLNNTKTKRGMLLSSQQADATAQHGTSDCITPHHNNAPLLFSNSGNHSEQSAPRPAVS